MRIVCPVTLRPIPVCLSVGLALIVACSDARVRSLAPPVSPARDAAAADVPVSPPAVDAGVGAAPADGLSLGGTCRVCDDFPARPIIDDGRTTTAPNAGAAADAGTLDAGRPTDAGPPVMVPADIEGMFGPADRGTNTGAPCLLEPENGTLLPKNWFRPRFRIKPTAGQSLFELRLTTPRQKNPLIVYTSGTSWTMPKAMWSALSDHAGDDPIEVTVRALGSDTKAVPAKSSPSRFSVAPVNVQGSIVYWTTSRGSALKGFKIPDEAVVSVLTPPQTQGRCVGCHTSTPDGLYVGFSASSDAGNGNPSHPDLRSAKDPMVKPDFLTPSAITLLGRNEQQFPAFSKGHWQKGDHVMLSMWMNKLMWTDLEAPSVLEGEGWGYLARNADPKRAAAYPAFSHDGSLVAYVSSSSLLSAGETTDGDIYVIPFAARKGGDAKPIEGGATAEWNEYYPSWSPDDRFVAYTRVPAMQDSHHAPMAEIFVVPRGGGKAVRFRANDPDSCAGVTSPGITNSWPKWGPQVEKVGDKTYYWLTFSSTRGEGKNPQLYVTPLIVDDAGALTTYPAIYLWNQPPTENNHTPSWDNFDIRVD